MRSKRSPIVIMLAMSAVFFVIFLGLSTYLFTRDRSENDDAGSSAVSATSALFRSKKDGVGILEIKGVILESKRTLKRLKQFGKDKFIKAVVLRVDSPGGAVAPSQEIFQAISKFKKPIIASMASVAASGGYYIACGAKKIIANAGTLTGSIGVRMDFVNLKNFYRWAKISRYTIKGGRFKDAGADYRQMSPQEKRLFQEMIDDVHMQFKKTVAKSRNLKLSRVNVLADGRIYSGAQAYRVKLVDQLGSITDAIELAGKMGKIEGEPRIYFPEKPRQRLLEILMDQSSDNAESRWSLRSVFLKWLGIPDLMNSATGLPQIPAPRLMWLWHGHTY